MINKWILNNFKSIDREKELEFRPLTIFTGANSSGKSTILQSILLVTQTLQDSIPSRSIVLNGGIKKFGSYSDIVNRRDDSKDITIGFDLSDNGFREVMFAARRRYIAHNITNAVCQFTISSNGVADNLQPSLRDMRLEATSKNTKEKGSEVRVYRDESHSEEETRVIQSCSGKYSSTDFNYKLTVNSPRLGFIGARLSQKHVGVGLHHFLPHYLIAYTTYRDQVKLYLSDILSNRESEYDLDIEEKRKILSAIKEECMAIADDIRTNQKYRPGSNFESKYSSLKSGRFTLIKMRDVLSASTLDSTELSKYIGRLQQAVHSFPGTFETVRVPIFLDPGVQFVHEYFENHIKYLGPLREEPKSLYPLEGSGSTESLGLKGENTAAIFHNNREKTINYIDPTCFENSENACDKKVKGTLAEAIHKWLVYLGVANEMNTNDKGKFGHELKITTDVPEMEQDLTHVGVGVSQVLPILVLCFLSGEGDVIILEQPELHLHPKVQARLADFFVSINALGKQCIIETHSEYMINRLRSHVAMSDDSKVADETMIYFVEKEDGHSKYRPVTINKYGVIEEWPKGFFDESERIAAEILQAGMAKKMQEEQDDYEE